MVILIYESKPVIQASERGQIVIFRNDSDQVLTNEENADGK